MTEVKLIANTVKELIGMGDIDKAVNVLIAEGYGGHVTVGALTSGITGGGGTTLILIDQPELVLNIAANVVMIPIRISAQVEVGIIGADGEVITSSPPSEFHLLRHSVLHPTPGLDVPTPIPPVVVPAGGGP